MKLSKRWTTVTPLSKAIALLLFILLPFFGFYIGTQYQKMLDQQTTMQFFASPVPAAHMPLQPYANPGK